MSNAAGCRREATRGSPTDQKRFLLDSLGVLLHTANKQGMKTAGKKYHQAVEIAAELRSMHWEHDLTAEAAQDCLRSLQAIKRRMHQSSLIDEPEIYNYVRDDQ